MRQSLSALLFKQHKAQRRNISCRKYMYRTWVFTPILRAREKCTSAVTKRKGHRNVLSTWNPGPLWTGLPEEIFTDPLSCTAQFFYLTAHNAPQSEMCCIIELAWPGGTPIISTQKRQRPIENLLFGKKKKLSCLVYCSINGVGKRARVYTSQLAFMGSERIPS
jgi:hypothetical protein